MGIKELLSETLKKFDFFNKSYSNYKPLPTDISCTEQLELMLDVCSSEDCIPNYSLFHTWLSSKLVESRMENIDTLPHVDSVSCDTYIFALLTLYRKYCIETDIKQIDRSMYKNFLFKKKLIRSYLQHADPSIKRLIDFMITDCVLPQGRELGEKLTGLSTVEIKARFFSAIENNQAHAVLKLLGSLNEHQLASGEKNYLEALYYFCANDFKEAIYYADKVEENDIDYIAVNRIKLEAYAFLGNSTELMHVLRILNREIISPTFLAYITEVLCSNSQNPTESYKQITEQALKLATTIAINPLDKYYTRFAKYHSRLLLELHTRLDEISASIIADEGPSSTHQDVNILSLLSPSDKRLNQLKIAVMLDKVPYDDPSLLCVYIINVLLQKHEKRPFDGGLFVLIFETMYKLEEYDMFLHNFRKHLQMVMRLDTQHSIPILTIAYQVQLMKNDTSYIKTIRTLEKLVNKEHLTKIKTSVERQITLNLLGARAKKSYSAALLALDYTNCIDNKWIDGGMLSLGFFRTIEMELNEKLFLPACKTIPYDVMLNSYAEMKQGEKNDWAISFKEYCKIMKKQQDGFNLGTMNILLAKLAKPKTSVGFGIQTLFHNAICQYLTDEGKVALASFSFKNLIGDEYRNKYRNPPAHTRYLPFHIVTECKEHVDKSLSALSKWLKLYANDIT